MKPLYIIIGAYGSGKSEFSIHLAKSLNQPDNKVVLADMDVVNPYFRTREVQEEFAQIGIKVIAPEGAFKHADLPMLSPSIKGAIENYEETVILDVGGDPVGCKILGRFQTEIETRGYQMLFVVNTYRPFTTNVDEILSMKAQMEASSRLKVTEFICNNNLMEYTTQEVVEEGIKILNECSEKTGLPFNYYLVLDLYQDRIPDGLMGKKRIIMNYTFRKPWEYYVMKGI